MSMFLSCLCHYFFIIAIFRSREQNRKCDWSSNVTVTCYLNVSNNSTEVFWVITVLQFWKSRHALLFFLWGVFEFFFSFLLFSHKMTKDFVHVGLFPLLCCVRWDILRGVNILAFLRFCLLFLCVGSVFLSLSSCLALLLLLTHPSDCSLQSKAHGRHRLEASRVMKKETCEQ